MQDFIINTIIIMQQINPLCNFWCLKKQLQSQGFSLDKKCLLNRVKSIKKNFKN